MSWLWYLLAALGGFAVGVGFFVALIVILCRDKKKYENWKSD